ncbi:LacI family transcriptional regulator [Microlunatus elymi]|uniref:LacI family transcriptional regulator n=1 Tax=Microlunatus elymi TaxID=2596828 RepID=A0A516Q1T2_9ACTN|nr:LacI family DNA-binding transcriptional regulator [Microlunatus elymi]QDP97395.1 LacI family transcriptional regulator [Microlunatus elymi]
MARVTIDDLAARLGLSRASVSYALNGRPGVGEQTRSRVLALAMELGWQPSVSARSLSRSRSDAYGLVIKRRPEELGSEPYYMALLSGIESALSEAGASLMLRFVTDRETESAVYRQWSAERRVDGVILTDLRQHDPRPRLLDELSLPYLVHGARWESEGWQFAQSDDAALLVAHLAGLGHTRIAHVSGPAELQHETERRTAVAEVAAQQGIRTITVEGDYSVDGAETVTRDLLRRRGQPTAIIYSNDLMAIGGMVELRAAGRVDIAMVSWDESLLCQTAIPGITALQRDPYHAGRNTASQLIRRAHAEAGAEVPDLTPVRSRLIIRDSSCPPCRQ